MSGGVQPSCLPPSGNRAAAWTVLSTECARGLQRAWAPGLTTPPRPLPLQPPVMLPSPTRPMAR